tara:strand:+ start:1333 stop:2712 length:1380 start_codon:yes stop_codon:yes gene_type:complete
MKITDLINKKVHIIGINGIGMSALAIYLNKNKIDVSGSDIAKNSNTEVLNKCGIPVTIGHKEGNIKNKDIIFYSSAIKNNPELKAAKRNKIPYFNRSKLLQIICKDKFTIVVSGSHGKTSTTSILGHLLVSSGLNPTIISGGIMKNFGKNIHLTESDYVVVEADESDGTIFKLKPNYLIYLNVDREHIDYYKSYSSLKSKIKKFILKTSKNSKVIINYDDKFLSTIHSPSKNIISFGKKAKSNYRYKNVELKSDKSFFDFYLNNKIIKKRISSPLLGEHNIQNLTSALSVLNELNIEINKKNIMSFKGTLRRMNILGTLNQSLLIDDYAHHPTEIQKLIEVCRLFKKKEIYLIIEPHRYTRLNDLYDEFLKTLKGIKNLNILKTYSAGEVLSNKMKDSKNLVNDLNVIFSQQVSYLDTYTEFFRLLDDLTLNNKRKIIIAAGAGSLSNQFRLYYESKKK